MDYDGGASSLAKWLVGTGCVIVTAVSLVGAVVVIECPLLSALSGAMAGTAIEIFMEVVISGETLENVDWGKVALAAAAGAVSGYLGPYIYATRSGAAYFMVDSSLDGLIGGIEHAARAWMDGEDGAHVIKSFGYGFAIGFALSAGFKAVGSIVEKLASRAAPSLAKLAEKVFPKLTAKVSALSAGFGKTIQQMKRAADASIFHSKYISKKLAQKQLMRLIEEGSDELVEKAFANLGSSDIVDTNGELMTKQALRDIFDKADDGATLAYFKRGDELVAIVKKHGMIGIVFDSSKYQTVTLPTELIADRGVNMEEAAKLLKKQWLDDPTLIPESLANAIKANGVDLEDMLPEDLVSIIQKSDWVLHENIDMRTVSLVPRILHDKGIGGIGHMGGYALAKYIPFTEFFQFCNFGKLKNEKGQNQTIATVMVKVYEEGYDLRHGVSTSIPVLINDLLLRAVFMIKQHFYEDVSWTDLLRKKNEDKLQRMISVGTGALCLLDLSEAAITSWGNWVVFFSHLNISAWNRLAIQGVKELHILSDREMHNIEMIESEITEKREELLQRSIKLLE